MYLTKLACLKRVALFVVFLILLFTSACFQREAGSPGSANETVIKPSPHVVSVTASTIGFNEDYHVILDANIKNEGAEGVIMVIASVTQAGNTDTKQIPITLGKGKSQVVRFIFPLKWEGGEWTPKVTTELP